MKEFLKYTAQLCLTVSLVSLFAVGILWGIDIANWYETTHWIRKALGVVVISMTLCVGASTFRGLLK